MRKFLLVAAILPAFLLAGCDTSKLPTSAQIQQVEVAIQNAAQAACKAAPTIESIGIIVAALIAGGSPIDQIANQVVNQFCTLVNNPPAAAGAHIFAVPSNSSGFVGTVNGYPIYKK